MRPLPTELRQPPDPLMRGVRWGLTWLAAVLALAFIINLILKP